MENADGQYGYDKPWQLLSETISSQRTWTQASDPYQPEWVAPEPPMLWQDADEWIRVTLVPPREGWGPAHSLTIQDVLNNNFTRLQKSDAYATESDDWSGVQSGYTGTMRPTGAGGGGVT